MRAILANVLLLFFFKHKTSHKRKVYVHGGLEILHGDEKDQLTGLPAHFEMET